MLSENVLIQDPALVRKQGTHYRTAYSCEPEAACPSGLNVILIIAINISINACKELAWSEDER